MSKTLLWFLPLCILISVLIPRGVVKHLVENEVQRYEAQRIQLRELDETEAAKLLLYNETQRHGLSYDDFKLLIRIAYAESGFRQFDATGGVLRGRIHPPDTGAWQINASVWRDTAESMGLNIETWEGNIKFAVWLYSQEGANPWLWSRKFWDKSSQ